MELSLEKRYEIVFLREHPAGPKFSFGFIAKQVRCSKSTAIYWVKRYHENRDLSTSERMGRPCVTSAKQDDKIVKMAEKEHNITAIQIQEKMEERGVGLSVETVRRRLRKSGGKFSNEISKPLLKEDHRKKRLQWAKKHKNFDWNRVVFTDESTFQLYTSKKRFGSFLVEKKCFVLLSIHQKFMFGDVFLLLDLVSYFAFRGTLMLNLCVLFMRRVFWLPPLNFLVKVT